MHNLCNGSRVTLHTVHEQLCLGMCVLHLLLYNTVKHCLASLMLAVYIYIDTFVNSARSPALCLWADWMALKREQLVRPFCDSEFVYSGMKNM